MLLVKLVEPPCTERYARWCERSGNLVKFPSYSISLCGKTAGAHAGHGVGEEKRLGLGNKVCFAMSMELLLRIVVV